MDIQLVTVLYRIGAYLAPEIPDHLHVAWDRAVERELVSPNGRHVWPAGEVVLRDGLQAVADRHPEIVARTNLVGGLLAVDVSKSTLSGPETWWAVQRTYYRITGHMVRVDQRQE